MKQTEKYIITEAQKAMTEIAWDYDTNKQMRATFTSCEEQINRAESVINHPKYQDFIATFKSYWTVGFDFPPEVELFHNAMFMHIDDENGEAYLLSHRDAAFKIKKGDDGKYIIYEKRTRGGDFKPV